jgi:hypothetical protein
VFMPLDTKLMPMRMQWSCPQCGHSIERPGTWFAHRKGRLVCENCQQANRFGYEEKVKLFCCTARRIAGERKTNGLTE